MTYYVIGAIVVAVSFGLGVLVYRWQRAIDARQTAAFEALLEANRAKARPGMERADRRLQSVRGGK